MDPTVTRRIQRTAKTVSFLRNHEGITAVEHVRIVELCLIRRVQRSVLLCCTQTSCSGLWITHRTPFWFRCRDISFCTWMQSTFPSVLNLHCILGCSLSRSRAARLTTWSGRSCSPLSHCASDHLVGPRLHSPLLLCLHCSSGTAFILLCIHGSIHCRSCIRAWPVVNDHWGEL